RPPGRRRAPPRRDRRGEPRLRVHRARSHEPGDSRRPHPPRASTRRGPVARGIAMRKLVLKMSLSSDGFVGGPNGEPHWLFRSMDAAATMWTVDSLWQAGLHIMGSRTFNDMAAYWPTSTEPFAAPMNEIPKVAFSRNGTNGHSAARGNWAKARVATGDLAEEIAHLKREPGRDIIAHGGGRIARRTRVSDLGAAWRLRHSTGSLGDRMHHT